MNVGYGVPPSTMRVSDLYLGQPSFASEADVQAATNPDDVPEQMNTPDETVEETVQPVADVAGIEIPVLLAFGAGVFLLMQLT